jgi:tetratricopeptide (TPR) repeat protein
MSNPLLRTKTALAALLVASLASARGELESALEAFKKGDYSAVVACATKVAEGHPERAKVLYLAGEAQLVVGRPAEAEEAFRGVLAHRDGSVPARVGLGRALTALGKLEDAEKELRAALAADAKDPQAHRALGDALLAAGKTKDAKASLDAAAKLAPGDPWVARSQVELALRTGDLAVAARAAKALSKARPRHPLGPFLAGLVHEKNGKTEKAIEAYEQALALDEAFLDAHKNLAILCHTMSATYSNAERVEKSLAHYERYFALGGVDPALENAYRQMKGFLGSMRRPGKEKDKE